MPMNSQIQTELENATRTMAAALTQAVVAGLQAMPDQGVKREAIEEIGNRVSALHTAVASKSNGDNPDPLIGLEHIRKNYFEPPMSKFAFYGGNGSPGFVKLLEVIDVGPRKRCVRRSNFDAVLKSRKRTAPVNHASQ